MGGRSLVSLEQRYRRVLDWEKDENAILVSFESLVGSKGGGSDAAQREAVERVASHLGLDVDAPAAERVQESLFGSSNTFRKGQIGGWRSELSDEHKDATKDVAGALLIELGYECGLDW